MQERIQKILSARGVCSRRKAEEYIQEGLVSVNGRKADLGQKADPDVDRIEVDGAVIDARKVMLYYLMHKPVDVETSNVEPAKASVVLKPNHSAFRKSVPTTNKTVRELLPPELQGKVFPVGRLDKDSSGLLLFTNDGVLAYRLTHPKFDHEKEYCVRLKEPIPEGAVKKIEQGVMLEGVKTKPAGVRKIKGDTLLITLTEGRNRQIRRMCSKVGYPVVELERVRIMTLTDEKLEAGKLRKLTEKECKELLQSVGL